MNYKFLNFNCFYNIIMTFINKYIKFYFFVYITVFICRVYKLKRNFLSKEFINKIKNLKFDDEYKAKDFNRILNYRGTTIEPEWEWAKNISFVYTWVDGSDINLANSKSKYNGGNKDFNSRDRSVDELLYSLRSLKKYLPWYNGTIFIVTNNQIPEWLDINNSQIKIINHEEIIPKYINPTFDSSTIECFLDKIPNISDIFIYMNDDFFFNNFVHPSFFFTSQSFYPNIFRTMRISVKKRLASAIIKENNIHHIYYASVYFTTKIIRQYFDQNFKYYNIAHCAYVCYRFFFEPFRQFFENELKIVFSLRFRSPYKPVTLYLYQMLLLYAQEKLIFNSTFANRDKLENFKKKFLFSNNIINKYSFNIIPKRETQIFVKFAFIKDNSTSNYKNFNFLMTNKNILLYNLNDEYNTNKSKYELTEYMMVRYPESNTFEKNDYINLEKSYLYKLEFVNETLKEINGEYYKKNKEIFNNFQKMFFNEKNLKYIEEYLDKKNKLSNNSNISKLDKEEIDVLLNYDGGKLEQKWDWIQNISIVYIIIDNDKNWLYWLKYSLRTLKLYLPWFFGTIYVITQNKEIDLSLSINKTYNIKIIHSKDIVAKKFLNNISREIIELYLDKIPFISEKFILLNQNHYFNHYIHPRFFFSNYFFPKYYFSPLNKEQNAQNFSRSSFLKTYK